MKEHKFDQETVETLSEILGQLAPLPANESPVSHLNIPKIEKLNGIARIKLSLQEGILKYQGEAVKKINLIKLAHTAVVELTLPSKNIFIG
ncbi:MAG: hypothetical protein HWD59_15175 [Coxiellaceae bacterium]|nr:MAG: hypothetical protein HWD59_15175 [Coxiellaceae bacterium]